MSEEKKPFFRYENFLIIIMFLTYGFVVVDRTSIMILFPFVAPDLGLNNMQIGMVGAILSVCWAFSSYIFSSISDLWAIKKKLLVGLVALFSLASISTGFAVSFFMLMVARALMGISEGPVISLAQASVLADSTPSRLGFNMGFVQSAGAIMANALGPIFLIIIAQSFGWRSSFFLLGIPSLILAAIMAKYMKEPRLSVNKSGDVTVRPRFADYKQVFKSRNVWVSVIMSCGFVAWLATWATFAMLAFTVGNNYSPAQASIIMSVQGIGGFIWAMVIPMMSDRVGRKPAIMVSSFVSIFFPIFLMPLNLNFLIVAAALFFLSFGNGYAAVIMSIVPSESVPRAFAATAISLTIFVGEIIGGTIVPIIAGSFADKFGLAAPMWIAMGAGAFVFLLSFALKETAPQIINRQPNTFGDIEPVSAP